jgi:hypothetical protein
MIRLSILLAFSLAHTACRAGEPEGRSAASGEVNNLGENRQRNAANVRTGTAMTKERILISADGGQVAAELVDNEAARALVRMLPVTIEMRNHLRQEKMGTLPSPLPEGQRQLEFAAGTLGVWGDEDLVIYYRAGRVPQPGIVILGRVTGDLSIFERPDSMTVRIQPAD